MKTKIVKSCYGTWMAETQTKLTDELHFNITTMKRHSGNITTTAQVGKKDGFFFIYEPFKDFSVTLICSSTRCTKLAVERQHSEALGMLEGVQAQALDHYNRAALPLYY